MYCVAVDLHGNIWVSTWAGVSKFDGAKWTTYKSYDYGLGSALVTNIAVDAQNNIWFCGPYDLTKFDGTRWIKYPIEKGFYEITSIAIDDQGNKWLGTWGGGIVELQD